MTTEPNVDPTLTLQAYWKSITSDKTKHPSHVYLLYDLLRGRDPHLGGFSRTTNPVKLANGQSSWNGLRLAAASLRWMFKRKWNSDKNSQGELYVDVAPTSVIGTLLQLGEPDLNVMFEQVMELSAWNHRYSKLDDVLHEATGSS